MTKEKLKGAFIALGTFDGLHIGHKAVINSETTEYENKFALMFCEHPAVLLSGDNPGKLLAKEKEKEILISWGITPEYIDFKEISQYSPEAFVDDILVEKYNAKSIACGFNYRFGRNAEGDVNRLKRLCFEREIKLTVVDEVQYKGEAVSSTRIREAIKSGDIKSANKMLGRPFSYNFQVLHGDERGRILGSPTINQFFPEGFIVPEYGVYASFTVIGAKKYPSVTNIGIRPTIGNSEKRSETNIIGFEGDLYGQCPEVFIIEKLRGEMQFNSLDELSLQIAKDREYALKIIKGDCYYGI